MLKRVFVITMCVSMLGMTVVPASWMPCCCKAQSKTSSANKPVPSCCIDKTVMNSSESEFSHRSCHETGLNAQQACACGTIVRGLCGACRCAEQVQVIALTGYFTQDEITKDHLSPDFSVSERSMITSAASRFVYQDVAPPGMVSHLKTFILIC